MQYMDYFLELFGGLPRAGPGGNAFTRQAFAMIDHLPASPRILDVGCGPGAQTLELLRVSTGTVLAFDLYPQMLKRLQASAAEAGLTGRLQTRQLDMHEMDFEPASFDLIWSEGAIYFLGFETGLRLFRRFLKPGGYVAVSEAVWLRPDPSPASRRFWAEYPEIDSVHSKLAAIARAGYSSVGHFILPAEAWTAEYYAPMAQRIVEKQAEWHDIPEARAPLDEASAEIATFRENPDDFSYAFFVMRG